MAPSWRGWWGLWPGVGLSFWGMCGGLRLGGAVCCPPVLDGADLSVGGGWAVPAFCQCFSLGVPSLVSCAALFPAMTSRLDQDRDRRAQLRLFCFGEGVSHPHQAPDRLLVVCVEQGVGRLTGELGLVYPRPEVLTEILEDVDLEIRGRLDRGPLPVSFASFFAESGFLRLCLWVLSRSRELALEDIRARRWLQEMLRRVFDLVGPVLSVAGADSFPVFGRFLEAWSLWSGGLLRTELGSDDSAGEFDSSSSVDSSHTGDECERMFFEEEQVNIRRCRRLAAREYAVFRRWLVAGNHSGLVEGFLAHLEGLRENGLYPSRPVDLYFDESLAFRGSESDLGNEAPCNVEEGGEEA